jgi:hypothetical protein
MAKNKTPKQQLPSPNNGIILFLMATLIYFIFKVDSKSAAEATSLFIIYIAVILIGETIINAHNSSIICGKAQISTAMWYTILPWVIIFGMLTMFLNMFPGWLIPFSNTFGYLIAKISGLDKSLENILKPLPTADEETSEALGKIYMDQSLLINQIPDPNTDGGKGFKKFIDLMDHGGLLKDDFTEGGKEEEDLKSYVILKNSVAECIWYMLAGSLTLTTSYNYIIQSSCNVSVKEMEKRHDKYEKEVAEETGDSIPPRVYSSYE